MINKLKKITKTLLTIFLTISVTCCNFEPKYKTPSPKFTLKTPKNKKETTWQNFFKSQDLQKIIKIALENNKDLKIANLNIKKARETHNIARANLLPSVNATTSLTRQEAYGSTYSTYKANLSIPAYELDFSGRLRNLKKSALEEFLATREARNITKIALIAQIASSYTDFLSDSKLLEIYSLAIEAQKLKYDLMKSRYENGISSKSDLLDVKSDLERAKMTYQNYKKLVAQDKNILMLLTGVFDEKSLPLESSLNDIRIDENLLEFTPSTTLLARPDIKQAEHILKSANANIGAARAAFFPSISLTGNYGYSSSELSNLFSSKAWSFTPQVNLPIFNAGKNVANLKIAKIRKKIEIINYEKAIQNAFKETLDDLATRKSVKKRLDYSERILMAKKESYSIAQTRHEVGSDDALKVMDSGLLLIEAEKNRVINQRDYVVNLISLYKVFGGN